MHNFKTTKRVKNQRISIFGLFLFLCQMNKLVANDEQMSNIIVFVLYKDLDKKNQAFIVQLIIKYIKYFVHTTYFNVSLMIAIP